MRLTAIDDAFVRRFAEDLARLIAADEPLGLAVSGGPDSLALLILAHAARPGNIRVATVDHGLRPEATEEAAIVARLCADIGLPYQLLMVDWPQGAPTSNVQAAARERRYQALIDWAKAQNLQVIATAHHADDQAETLLMRLARGAGLSGLAGARPSRPLTEAVRVIRPLLSWQKAELETLVAAAGLRPADDRSNRDPAHDRARLRAVLAEAGFGDAAGFASSARHLADAEDALLWSLGQLAEQRLRPVDRGWQLAPDGLPIEYLRRLVGLVLARCGADAPRGPQLTQAIASVTAGDKAMLGDVTIEKIGEFWRFEPAPPRRTL